jgi:predicted signal transduction protein with EAL and GGDEF domain
VPRVINPIKSFDPALMPAHRMAFIPHDGSTAQGILNRADLAMYEAKQIGGSALRFFENSKRSTRQAQHLQPASTQH